MNGEDNADSRLKKVTYRRLSQRFLKLMHDQIDTALLDLIAPLDTSKALF
jgi:hypothetical protein